MMGNLQFDATRWRLKLQPVHSRHPDVEDQASGLIPRGRCEKFFADEKAVAGQAGRVHQAPQGVSKPLDSSSTDGDT